jgi:hypothetical protein
MDHFRFDDLARSLASSSRRTILRRLARLALGGTLVPVFADEATEAHDLLPKCKKLKGEKKKKCLKKAKQHNAAHTVAPPPESCASVPCIDQGPASCGMNGVCSGGVCQTYPVGTSCRPGSCANGRQTVSASCDSAGTCPPMQQEACPNGNCNASGTACGPCGSDVHCGSDRWCDAGICRAKRVNGDLCGAPNHCLSNNCVGGRCCNHPCVGPNANRTGNCSTGFCVLTCDEGWGNCDGDLTTGCEADLLNDPNCGICGRNCPATFPPCLGQNTFKECQNGTCVCTVRDRQSPRIPHRPRTAPLSELEHPNDRAHRS